MKERIVNAIDSLFIDPNISCNHFYDFLSDCFEFGYIDLYEYNFVLRASVNCVIVAALYNV